MLPAGREVGFPTTVVDGPPVVGVSMITGVASVSRFPAFRTPTDTDVLSCARRVPPGGRVSE